MNQHELDGSTYRPKVADTLLAIATYNEIDNLPRLVDRIFEVLPDCHLLIVDDNSPDGTGRWCDERATGDHRLRCLHRAGKLGLGTATIAGLSYAIEHGYAQVITMDADWSHDPSYLVAMVERLHTTSSPADVVIGSRYVRGGRVEGWPWRRRWMSRAVNRFAQTWLRLPVHDASGAFRCYRTDVLRKVDLSRLRARGYSVFEELLWVLHRQEARFVELPITFTDRHRGHSKISLQEAVTSWWHLMRLPWQA